MHRQPPDKPRPRPGPEETWMLAQLEPLAELTPPRRTPMDPKNMARLVYVRVELKGAFLLCLGVEATELSHATHTRVSGDPY